MVLLLSPCHHVQSRVLLCVAGRSGQDYPTTAISVEFRLREGRCRLFGYERVLVMGTASGFRLAHWLGAFLFGGGG